MKSVKVSELKNNLRRFLDYVRRGGTVRVYDRESAIADRTPCRGSSDARDGDAVLVELERAGILRRGTGKLPCAWRKRRLPPAKVSVVDALLDERRNDR